MYTFTQEGIDKHYLTIYYLNKAKGFVQFSDTVNRMLFLRLVENKSPIEIAKVTHTELYYCERALSKALKKLDEANDMFLEHCPEVIETIQQNEALNAKLKEYEAAFSALDNERQNFIEINRKRALSIKEIDFTTRTVNTLRYMRVKTVGDLLKYSVKDIKAVKNSGVATVNEIINTLSEMGFTLK